MLGVPPHPGNVYAGPDPTMPNPMHSPPGHGPGASHGSPWHLHEPPRKVMVTEGGEVPRWVENVLHTLQENMVLLTRKVDDLSDQMVANQQSWGMDKQDIQKCIHDTQGWVQTALENRNKAWEDVQKVNAQSDEGLRAQVEALQNSVAVCQRETHFLRTREGILESGDKRQEESLNRLSNLHEQIQREVRQLHSKVEAVAADGGPKGGDVEMSPPVVEQIEGIVGLVMHQNQERLLKEWHEKFDGLFHLVGDLRQDFQAARLDVDVLKQKNAIVMKRLQELLPGTPGTPPVDGRVLEPRVKKLEEDLQALVQHFDPHRHEVERHFQFLTQHLNALQGSIKIIMGKEKNMAKLHGWVEEISHRLLAIEMREGGKAHRTAPSRGEVPGGFYVAQEGPSASLVTDPDPEKPKRGGSKDAGKPHPRPPTYIPRERSITPESQEKGETGRWEVREGRPVSPFAPVLRLSTLPSPADLTMREKLSSKEPIRRISHASYDGEVSRGQEGPPPSPGSGVGNAQGALGAPGAHGCAAQVKCPWPTDHG